MNATPEQVRISKQALVSASESWYGDGPTTKDREEIPAGAWMRIYALGFCMGASFEKEWK